MKFSLIQAPRVAVSVVQPVKFDFLEFCIRSTNLTASLYQVCLCGKWSEDPGAFARWFTLGNVISLCGYSENLARVSITVQNSDQFVFPFVHSGDHFEAPLSLIVVCIGMVSKIQILFPIWSRCTVEKYVQRRASLDNDYHVARYCNNICFFLSARQWTCTRAFAVVGNISISHGCMVFSFICSICAEVDQTLLSEDEGEGFRRIQRRQFHPRIERSRQTAVCKFNKVSQLCAFFTTSHEFKFLWVQHIVEPIL